ncbi:NUDIX hydrolase [Archangium violaceum]|uniref:NUDIX domain-containing protein n=1 Tax=Archangium violaceum TaxID=83451 RepID=UPI00193C7023|nr:NUDIX hydrolase [Archangium violaceum]QRK07357.1 NUDIX hydrolase [Archangium violaceum]
MAEDSERNPWTTLSSALKYENPWIRVTEHQVLNPKGRPGIYGTVHFRNLAVGVLPIDAEGYTWLVGQYRYPLNQYSWEIPEGGGKLGEDPLLAAKRELQEEVGLIAGSWQELMRMHLSNSVTDELSICYVAWSLSKTEAAPEETEELKVRRLPFSEAFAMVERGEITDSISVAAILKVQLMILSGKAPAGL